MSQRDVSEQLGLDASTLSRLETGRGRWHLETFVQYSCVVGADPAEVLARILQQLGDGGPVSLWENTQ